MKTVLTLILFFAIAPSAFAQGVRAVKGGNYSHTLMAGGGIAHPSATTAIGTNPAGLIYNTGMRLSHGSAIDDSRSGTIGQQGLLLGGNSFFGAAVGISDYQNTAADPNGFSTVGSGTLFQGGWAGHIQKSRLAFGMSLVAPITGGRIVQNSGSSTANQPAPSFTNQGAAVNAGVIFDPFGSTRFGFSLLGMSGGIETIGFGLAFDIVDNVSLVGDLIYSKSSKSMDVIPGLNFSTQYFSLSANYGSRMMGDGWTYGREGFGGGIGFTAMKELSVTVQYHQIQKFMVELTAQM